MPVADLSSTEWRFKGGWFLMPRTASSTAAYRLDFGVSAALAAGVEVYAADLAMGDVVDEAYAFGGRGSPSSPGARTS